MRMIFEEYYYKYPRMNPECYEDLLKIGAPLITKQDSNCRKCIPAKNSLAITLRYLVEGFSQQALSLSFRVPGTGVTVNNYSPKKITPGVIITREKSTPGVIFSWEKFTPTWKKVLP